MIVYFLVFLSWLIGLFFIGAIISFLFFKSRFNPNLYELILRNIFLGYILVIVVQSIISTDFKTINLVLLLILFFATLEINKYKVILSSKRNNINYKFIFTIFISLAVLFLYSWLLIIDTDSSIKFWGSEDYILYGKISKFIASTGQENGFNVFNTIDKFYNGPEPYHYFDLWGAAVVSNVFRINNYISLKLIIYPTFYFLYALGILAIINRNDFKTLLLTFALLLVGGMSFGFHSNIKFLDNLENISFNLLDPNFSKLSYFYAFIMSSYLLYKNNFFSLAFLCILSLTVANIITFPTILPALFLVLVIGFFAKSLNKEIIYKCFFYLVVCALSFILFYALFKRQSSGFAGTDINSPLKLLNDNILQNSLITQRNIVLASILGILIIYIPFFIIVFKDIRSYDLRNYKSNTPKLFVVIGILVSILIWCVLYTELNSRQIHQNLSIPLLNIAFSVFILNLLNRKVFSKSMNVSIWNFYLLLIMVLIFQNLFRTIHYAFNKKNDTHSIDYLSKIRKELIPNTLIASLKGAESSNGTNNKYDYGYTLGDYLFLMDESVSPVNVGDLNLLIDSTSILNMYRSKKVISVGIFYRYSQLAENSKLAKDEIMLKFLKKYNIKQMIISKNASIPDTVLYYVKSIITDRISGEKFAILDL